MLFGQLLENANINVPANYWRFAREKGARNKEAGNSQPEQDDEAAADALRQRVKSLGLGSNALIPMPPRPQNGQLPIIARKHGPHAVARPDLKIFWTGMIRMRKILPPCARIYGIFPFTDTDRGTFLHFCLENMPVDRELEDAARKASSNTGVA